MKRYIGKTLAFIFVCVTLFVGLSSIASADSIGESRYVPNPVAYDGPGVGVVWP